MDSNKPVGDILRIRRLELRCSLHNIAELVGVSHNYISKIEKGENSNPSDEIIIKLASALEMDEDSLFASFGKISVSARETLLNNPILAKAFSEIDSSKKLSEEKQLELKEIFIHLYKNISSD